MRYAYISTPDDEEYILFHRAFVSEENGRVSLYYYVSKVTRSFPVTFKSKGGILLNITPLSEDSVSYHMFIPETNPYFNMNVLADGFSYLDLDVTHPEIKEVARTKMHNAFKKVLKEYKK